MASSNPCVLIGWDAATFDLLLPWVKEGRLPNLARMMANGSVRTLRSVIPPMSAAAWVSILTGKNPGKHGILDFSEIDARHYLPRQKTLINSTHFSGTTIFDLMSKAGRRVCSLQLLLTYPVWPVNGVMLAGIPNPDDSQPFTYPPGLDFGPLMRHKTRQVLSFEQEYENAKFHIQKLTDIFCRQAQDNFDFLAIYFRESDDFQHHYWRLLDESCPGYDAADRARMGNPILSVYERMDESLGRLLAARPDANFFLISDHGATRGAVRRFYLSQWLEHRGYLQLHRSIRGTFEQAAVRLYRRFKHLIPWQVRSKIANEQVGVARMFISWRNSVHSIDWSRTRAYVVGLNFPTAGIQINLRGRQPQGCVAPGPEHEKLCAELLSELRSIKDPVTDQPVIQQAWRKEELFSGPYVERMPDLIFVHNLDASIRLEMVGREWDDMPVAEFRALSGAHAIDGILVACGPSIRPGEQLPIATILDVAPTLLYSLGLPVPDSMDGAVLKDVFTPTFVGQQVVQNTEHSETALQASANVYSEEEETAIRERLQSLGYLDE